MSKPKRIKSKISGEQAEVKKSASLIDAAAFEIFNIVPTTSNIRVSVSSAMKVPAVSHAVKLIAGKIGDLPPKLYKRATKETVQSHPAYKLIHGEANEWTSAPQLRIDLTIDALLQSNGYALVNRSGDGRPLELLRLDPGKVRFEHEEDGTPYYMVTADRGQVRYEYSDMLHIQPIGGVSPIKLGRDSIALAIAFERHIASLFANGGRPSGIVMDTKIMTPQQKLDLAKDWFVTHSGQNAGSTAVLDGGRTYQALSTTLTDAQFYENKLEQVREIARLFDVPPTMLFELTRGTWSNTEEMARQFYVMTLQPWLTAWQWAYERVLLTPKERESLYIEFNVDGLLSADSATKSANINQARSAGVMTANEARALLNMPAHPDGNQLGSPHITTNTPAAPVDPESPKEEEQ